MTLEEEVLAVIRHERSLRGSARLSVREISKQVGQNRWEFLTPAEKLHHFISGTYSKFYPADEDVHEAIHELQKTHRNLVSLRPPPQRYLYPRLVHSR